jgi:hypothetical protein
LKKFVIALALYLTPSLFAQELNERVAKLEVIATQNQTLIQQGIKERREIRETLNRADGALTFISWLLSLSIPAFMGIQIYQAYENRKRNGIIEKEMKGRYKRA